MKNPFARLLAAGMLMCAIGLGSSALAADEAAKAPAATATVVAQAATEPAAAAPAASAPAAAAAAPAASGPAAAAPAAAAPVPNKGDVAWMTVATILVAMMSIPGLALFYGGLVRSKNMLSVLMQVFMVFSLIMVLWAIYGYSLAFTQGGSFIGSFDRLFLKGMTVDTMTGTFSKGVVIPEFTFVTFQATFAAITCGLIIGAFAERVRFSAVLLFVVLWFTFSYLPIAHMVWFWPGPDAFTSAAAAETATAASGWLFQKGALDFAGGTVVHINAAVAGLVGAFVIGKRIGYGREAMAPHSLTMTMIGASLLWVGWFGFNAGSGLEANGLAAMATLNTMLATAAAVVTWTMGEWMAKGKPSMLGAASGAVAGLVAITPAAGFVSPMGALMIGLLVSFACYGAILIKGKLGYDDSLDVFGVHGVGGAFGAIAVGIFATSAMTKLAGIADAPGGLIEGGGTAQVVKQLISLVAAAGYSFVVSFILLKLVDMTIGLRVSPEEEELGLDLTQHGERGYIMGVGELMGGHGTVGTAAYADVNVRNLSEPVRV
jgi:Amt family ammonium transporter